MFSVYYGGNTVDVVLVIFLLRGAGEAYSRMIWGKRPPRFWDQVHVQDEGMYTCTSTVYIYYLYLYPACVLFTAVL